jgi:hypothetical protein
MAFDVFNLDSSVKLFSRFLAPCSFFRLDRLEWWLNCGTRNMPLECERAHFTYIQQLETCFEKQPTLVGSRRHTVESASSVIGWRLELDEVKNTYIFYKSLTEGFSDCPHPFSGAVDGTLAPSEFPRCDLIPLSPFFMGRAAELQSQCRGIPIFNFSFGLLWTRTPRTQRLSGKAAGPHACFLSYRRHDTILHNLDQIDVFSRCKCSVDILFFQVTTHLFVYLNACFTVSKSFVTQ